MKGTHSYPSKTVDHRPDFIRGFHSFTLIPNTQKVGVKRGHLLLGWVVFPLCISHFVCREILTLGWDVYAMTQIPIGVILLNTYYFFIRNRKTAQSLQLCLELNELCLKSEGRVLHRQQLDQLHIQQLCWEGGRQDMLPAIRIMGKEFPVMVIGCSAGTSWHGVQQSIEFTDYWLNPSSWKEFQALFFPLQLNRHY